MRAWSCWARTSAGSAASSAPPTGLQDEFGAERVHRHAAGRVGDHRRRDRHGALRPAPGAGDPVRRLHLSRLRSDRERAGQVPLPLGRRVPGAGRHPHAGRRRHQGRALPLAVARGAVHPHPGPEGGLPSNPIDAKGLLASAIRGEDPVIFMEPKRVYRAARGDVPAGDYTIPLGEAKVVAAQGAARSPSSPGARWSTPRSRRPSKGAERGLRSRGDRPAHAAAVRHRGHASTSVREDRPGGDRARGAAHLRLRRRAGGDHRRRGRSCHLEAPILRVTGFDTPFPYTLEHEYLPDADRDPGRRRAGRELLGAWRSAVYEFRLPDIGEGVVEGEVVRWLVKEGDPSARTSRMVEVMTDKATVEIPSPRAGTVAQLHVRRGADLPGRQGADRHRDRTAPQAARRAAGAAGAAPAARGRRPPRSHRRRQAERACNAPRRAAGAGDAGDAQAGARPAASTSAGGGHRPSGRITSDDVRPSGARRRRVPRRRAHAPSRRRRRRRARPVPRRAQEDRREPGARQAHGRALHLRRGGRRHRAGRAARASANAALAAAARREALVPARSSSRRRSAALKKFPQLNATLDEAARRDRPAAQLPHRRGHRDRRRADRAGGARRRRESLVELAPRDRAAGRRSPAPARRRARSSPARRSPSPAWARSAG